MVITMLWWVTAQLRLAILFFLSFSAVSSYSPILLDVLRAFLVFCFSIRRRFHFNSYDFEDTPGYSSFHYGCGSRNSDQLDSR